MNKIECVAGIYLERTGGRLLLMSAQREGARSYWDLEYIAHKDVTWHPQNQAEALAKLRYLLEIVQKHGGQPKNLAIACYGPFTSPSHNDQHNFGAIHKEFADPPFQNVDLSIVARSVLGESWGRQPLNDGTTLLIQTDANACALGEAYTRNTAVDESERDHTLAFVLCCEGIGLGLVRGRQFIPSALHPEIGLIPPRVKRQDPIRPRKEDIDYSAGLSELADDYALIERFIKITGNADATIDEVKAHTDDAFWNFRAYYLAQACLACTVIRPPNSIAIGAKIDPLSNAGPRTQIYFQEFLQARRADRQPVIEYDDLRKDDYISNLTSPVCLPKPHDLSATGALGMCYAAASATEFGHLHRR